MQRAPASLVAFTLALALGLGASTSRAEPTAGEKETARQALAEGKRKLAAGDAAGALASMEAAYALVRVPTTAVALAQAQAANGKLVEARDTALAAAAMPTEGNEAFERAAAEAKDLAARLAARVPTIRLQITPAEALVEIDGQQVAPAVRAAPIRLNPGAHRVHVSAKGFAPADRAFALPEASTAEVNVALEPGDDGATANAPATPIWVWIAGGAGIVLAGVAVGARIDEASVEAKIRDKCNGDVLHGCPARSVYDPGPDDAHKHVAFGVFLGTAIGGGAALAAAAVGFIASRRGGEAPATTGTLRVEPRLGPGHAGLAIGGTF